MKTLKMFIVLCIMLVFNMNEAKPQAIVFKGGTWYWGPYTSTETLRIDAPSGNNLITTIFQLALNDPRVPATGVNKIPVSAQYWDNGELCHTLDGEVIITSDGKAKAVFHVNGQHETIVITDNTCMPFYSFCKNTPETVCGDSAKEIEYWNGNFHMKAYGAFIGQTTGFHYSWTGICNERIEYPGGIIAVPLLVKMENEVIAVIYYYWYVIIDINGEITLDDEAPGTYGECK